MYKWILCDWEDVQHLRKIAKTEGHNVNPSINTVWYGLTNNKEYVGSAGILLFTKQIARLKSMYILPEYRKQGYGTKAVEIRESYVFNTLSYRRLDVISRFKKYWQQRGYRVAVTINDNKDHLFITSKEWQKENDGN
tara:strand:+ start:819 stop:1229 length:411 start_codon:yes stop_codon:yes gene_type:complete